MSPLTPALRARAFTGGLDRRLGFSSILAVILASAGCGGPAPGEGSKPDLGENAGLVLPPGFKPVDLPVDQRKEIFREAHRTRALAVREANAKLPMDEAHLPIGDTPAFDKRVADHKAIIEEVLAKNLDELAKRHNITRDDLEKIEDEARKLRWIPPEEPNPGGVGAKSYEGPKPEKEKEKVGEKPAEEAKPAKEAAKEAAK